MTSVHKLLVATDLSPEAGQAARRAARIARQRGNAVDLLHVIESSGLTQLQEFFGKEGSRVARSVEEVCRQDLEDQALAAGESLGVSIGRHLRHGKVLEEISATADGLASDLLVVGAHGAGSIRQLLLGSTAERLLRRARLPLLVARGAADKDYHRVLVAIDFSSGAHTAVRLAQAVAPGVELSLVHVFEIPFESKLRFAGTEESVLDQHRARARHEANARLHAFAREAGLDTHDHHPLVMHGHPAQRLLEAARQLSADLIVMCKHGISMTDEVLLGSVTRQILSEADCDVLVVR